jgi:hypothetical protein
MNQMGFDMLAWFVRKPILGATPQVAKNRRGGYTVKQDQNKTLL